MPVLKSIAEEIQLQLLSSWPCKVLSLSQVANSCSFYATTYKEWLASQPRVHRVPSTNDGMQLLKQHELSANFRSTQKNTRAFTTSLEINLNKPYLQLTKNLTSMSKLLPSLWERLEHSATGTLVKLFAMIVESSTQYSMLGKQRDRTSISIQITDSDKKLSNMMNTAVVVQKNFALSESSQYQIYLNQIQKPQQGAQFLWNLKLSPN